MLQQTRGTNGPRQGDGVFVVARKNGGEAARMEYHYEANENGEFFGSIASWVHSDDDSGLIAYKSRAMPSREAVVNWIFCKAEKLSAME